MRFASGGVAVPPLCSLNAVSSKPADAVTHFLGGFIRERDRHHLVGFGEPAADDVRDAKRDHARLPRARAGKNQERTFGLHDGIALLGVQPFEERRLSWRGRSGGHTEL